MDKLIDSINSIEVTKVVNMFDILVAIAIVIVFFLLRSIVAAALIKIAYKIKKKDDEVTKNPMYSPLKVFFSFLGIYLAIGMLPVNSQIRAYADLIFEIVVMLTVTALLSSLITPKSFIFRTYLNRSTNNMINNFLCKIIQLCIWVVAIFIILYKQHINLSGLATGLGISSAIIALAAQDIVKNILSGMTILTDKPFVIGDWIQIGEFEGTVIDITFRSTRIRAADTTIVTIPNEKISSDSVINATRRKQRRIDLHLNLAMDTNAEQIKDISKKLKIVLENSEHVVPDSAHVSLFEIGTSSLDLKIYFYIDVIVFAEYLDVKEQILCNLLEILEKENVHLAYPTQTLYLKNGETKNEDFLPDDKKNKKSVLKETLEKFGKLRNKEEENN